MEASINFHENPIAVGPHVWCPEPTKKVKQQRTATRRAESAYRTGRQSNEATHIEKKEKARKARISSLPQTNWGGVYKTWLFVSAHLTNLLSVVGLAARETIDQALALSLIHI